MSGLTRPPSRDSTRRTLCRPALGAAVVAVLPCSSTWHRRSVGASACEIESPIGDLRWHEDANQGAVSEMGDGYCGEQCKKTRVNNIYQTVDERYEALNQRATILEIQKDAAATDKSTEKRERKLDTCWLALVAVREERVAVIEEERKPVRRHRGRRRRPSAAPMRQEIGRAGEIGKKEERAAQPKLGQRAIDRCRCSREERKRGEARRQQKRGKRAQGWPALLRSRDGSDIGRAAQVNEQETKMARFPFRRASGVREERVGGDRGREEASVRHQL
ncbi:hypothetical protein ZIOFF_032236 [Zingiber officinale]|uniref:Uncharacterized protein n=1 Tax=Zingiber officinale TaxID=94328 RepID=A0A8J5GV45_ZINOF|nr:hypothetical protein ZIOFF_032236 [Zingiber officinale]